MEVSESHEAENVDFAEARARARRISITLLLPSFVLLPFSFATENALVISIAFLVLYSALGVFCYSEGFHYSPPERSRVGIWLARFTFVSCALGVPVAAVMVLLAAVS